ncbi:MAG TPA: ribonuclease H-like domain-containing protein [Armatimonadota bacterium]|jgi:hypothetical protein
MSELIPRHVRRRLAALRREQLSAGAEPGSAPPPPATEPTRGPAPAVRLRIEAPTTLPPGEELETEQGPCLSFRLAPGHAHTAYEPWLAQALTDLAGHPLPVGPRHEALYLDLETLGLSGVPVFLVGLLHVGPGGFHLHQFLARDYSEEAALLLAIQPLLAGVRCLLTYNGRSFDWPFLRDRCALYGLPLPPEPRHVDLLHLARKCCRGFLPNCSLGTVESHLLGVERCDDVPGHLIPDLYHRAVAEDNLQLLAPVLHHNQLDLLTLACLTALWREHLQ